MLNTGTLRCMYTWGAFAENGACGEGREFLPHEIFTDCIFYEDMVLENLLLPKLHKKAEEKASAFLHFGANSAII